jgi:ferrous iron transport protein B
MHRATTLIDNVVLNPFAGPFILLGILFLMFQAVFTWAALPMEWIDGAFVALQNVIANHMPDNFLRSLLLDGILAGVGSVVIFLPQILILFFFIHLLDQSGYMTRAAFMMDRLMARVGLSGHTFIPLLSSFACAIPGIMAARTVEDSKDRFTTIMIAPLMTCAARLPVYTLIIAAFIPPVTVAGGVQLQGLVMFALYIAGIASALIVAAMFNMTGAARQTPRWFMMELPRYRLPSPRDLVLGLLARASVFLRRAGTIIMASTILLWVLASYPAPPADAERPDVIYSFAGMIGRALEVVFAPIGFTWDICIALIPGMAAREVAVAALGTIYALSGSDEAIAESLSTTLQTAWSLPTALAFLAWFVFAPQCFATLAVARREMNSWKWASFMFGYLFVLAYIAAGATYYIARALLS